MTSSCVDTHQLRELAGSFPFGPGKHRRYRRRLIGAAGGGSSTVLRVTGRADGLERLRRWSEEHRGVPPAFDRLGASFDDVLVASTSVRLPLSPELLLPDGGTSGAVTALLADFGLTTSVISSLPDLRGVTTVSMTVDHLALPSPTGALLATCTASPYVDGSPQHATGTLRDESGRLVAHASGWFLPTRAEAVSAERVVDVAEPPAHHLFDLLNVASGDRFSLVARDALSNAIGSLHGGIGALACSLAAEHVLAEMRPLTASFAYLRPTPRDGAVDVAARVVREGRRTGAAEATITDEHGRVLLSARVLAHRKRRERQEQE
jgi:uncharacterized protein (TIGR00369 family)